ncbi:hypothetical protein [Clostridium sp. Cult3]|uniref:hypothetical protein n=1 Tax=Clostridium sp. Cult3 TaxID=2079004 RepID=UPI001F307C56|nr:hypothetical protein [Clostridium sp. Cult3]MCF6461498.1 hypothetical protein [Clostridium sp. Cult3]
MSKVYDISAKLTNEKPKIQIAENKIYEVDNRKNTILKMQQMLQKADIDDLDFLDEAIEMLLGEKAAKELAEMDLSIKNYQVIFVTIVAAIQEIEYEQAEGMFRKATDL